MTPEDILKKFKSITPDREYTRKSRLLIVGEDLSSRKNVFRFIFQNLQTGAAVALAVVALVLIFGGASLWQGLNPLKLSSLDPANLKAEADAIDIQIQLSNLNPYTATSGPALANTASTSSQAAPATDQLKQEAQSLGLDITASPNATGSTQNSVTIDDALDALSK